ncbi:hypothetical protein TNCT_519691, partial [Trichonephila clavata]
VCVCAWGSGSRKVTMDGHHRENVTSVDCVLSRGSTNVFTENLLDRKPMDVKSVPESNSFCKRRV